MPSDSDRIDDERGHASEERDALLAQALNPFTQGSNVVHFASESEGERARSGHDDSETEEREGELVELPTLTSENDEECSGVRLELTT